MRCPLEAVTTIAGPGSQFWVATDRMGTSQESTVPEKTSCHQLVLPGVLNENLIFIAMKLALSKLPALFLFLLFRFFQCKTSCAKLLAKVKPDWEVWIKTNKHAGHSDFKVENRVPGVMTGRTASWITSRCQSFVHYYIQGLIWVCRWTHYILPSIRFVIFHYKEFLLSLKNKTATWSGDISEDPKNISNQ